VTRTRVSPEELAEMVEGQTIVSMFRDVVRERADQDALRWKAGDSFDVLTYQEYGDRASAVAGGLRELGVGAGDRVSLMIANRPEFHIVDVATMLLGAVPTSIYGTSSPEQIAYQVGHAGSKVIVVDGQSALDRVIAVRSQLPLLQAVVAIDDVDAGGATVLRFADVTGTPVDLDEAASRVRPEDLATIIYTSGTTGSPKAAAHSHSSLRAAAESVALRFGDFTGKRILSYLPFAHIGERLNSHYVALRGGYITTSCPDVLKMAEYIYAVRPQMFFGPPRIWEKLWGGLDMIVQYSEGEKKERYEQALEVGRAVAAARRAGGQLDAALAQRWEAVDETIRELRAAVAMDDLEIAVTAAAALPAHVLDGWASVGVQLADMYGMSEFSCGTGDPYDVKVGRLGRPYPGAELRVAEDGEIELRGPQMFVGYLDDPERTAEVMTDDGWLRTGDIGELDEDGYLRLVDRKKDLIITSGGKNVAPAVLEGALVGHPLVGNVVVIGEARKFVTALCTLDPQAAPEWAKAREIEGDLAALAEHPEVVDEVERWVAEVNERFSRVEQIKAVTILGSVWGPDSDELTPTMKVRRRAVHTKYADRIEAMYA
jgi:long-chain acyl-CoA synthetase